MSAQPLMPSLTERYPELGTGPIPTDVYWRPEFYARELEAIFRRTWMCMGRVEELRQAGDFFVRDIPTFEMSILIVRGKDCVVRAFHNVCQHRGNHVALDKRGNCSGFSCPFHGWHYALDGRLAGVPDAEGFFGLDRKNKGLPAINIDFWEGFIFINLAATPATSLVEAMGEQGADLVGYPFHRGTQIFEFEGTVNCNWKNMLDSFAETYHVPFLHHNSVKLTLAGPDNPFGRLIDVRIKGPHRTASVVGNPNYQPNPVQGLAFQYAPGPSITSGAMSEGLVLPKGLNQTRASNWSIDVTMFFPNWIIVMGAGMYFTHQMWPTSADSVVWQMRGYVRPASNAAQRFGQENSMVELRDAVLEDGNTLERIHRAMKQGLIKEFVYHDHELALRHHYHTVVNWVADYEAARERR